jgi:murein DD-endopeptidase MepM/ murein hydrolase activator NlpD/soluble lytic murein transglycosylase-like protein
MYLDTLGQKARNGSREIFLAQAFAAFAKDDQRGYGSERLPLQVIKSHEVIRQMTDESNRITASTHFANKTKLEKAIQESAGKFEPLLRALEKPMPHVTIIEKPPKTAEMAEKARLVGRHSVDAAKVASTVTKKAALPSIAASGIALQSLATPSAAHAANVPRVKSETVASQVVDMSPVAFAEKTQPKTKEQLKDEAFRAEINNRVAQSEKLGGMWAKWDTVDPDKLYHALIKYENKYKNKSPIDRYDALAQAWQESRLKGNAVSGAGAIGLTQFMPDTWKGWMKGKSPYDTDASIEALFKYDSYIYKKMDNKFPGYKVETKKKLTFGGYNAGPGAVSDGRLPNYTETRTYVSNIMADAAKLRADAAKAAKRGVETPAAPAPRPAAPAPKPESKPTPAPEAPITVPKIDVPSTPSTDKPVDFDPAVFGGQGGGNGVDFLPPSESTAADIPPADATAKDIIDYLNTAPTATDTQPGNSPESTPAQGPDVSGTPTTPVSPETTPAYIDVAALLGSTGVANSQVGSALPEVAPGAGQTITSPDAAVNMTPAGGLAVAPNAPEASVIPASTSEAGASPTAPATGGATPDQAPITPAGPDSAPNDPAAVVGAIDTVEPSQAPADTGSPSTNTPQNGSNNTPDNTAPAAGDGKVVLEPTVAEQPATSGAAPSTGITVEPDSTVTQPAESDPAKPADKPADNSTPAPAAEKPKDNNQEKPAPKQETPQPKPEQRSNVQIINGPVTSDGKGLPVAPEVMKKYGIGTKFLGYTNDRPGHHHDGADIPVPVGTPVLSIDDGVVVHVGPYRNSTKSGILNVIVKFKDGTWGNYEHVSTFKVKEGQNVVRGQVIALSGNSGAPNFSTGPHLHVTIAAKHDTDGYVGVDSPRVLQDAIDPQKVWPSMGQTKSWLKNN